MRRFDELKTTTNSRVYRMLARGRDLNCGFCPPNKGCNSTLKNQEVRSWKCKWDTLAYRYSHKKNKRKRQYNVVLID